MIKFEFEPYFVIYTDRMIDWCKENNVNIFWEQRPIFTRTGDIEYIDYITHVYGKDEDMTAFRLKFGL